MKRIVLFAAGLFFLHISCNTYTQGERIFQSKCANCHGMEGEGLADMYPALSNSAYMKNRISELPCIIINGKYTLDKKGNKISEMPPLPKMGDVELTNLINYLQNRFSKNKPSAQLDSIVKWKKRCK